VTTRDIARVVQTPPAEPGFIGEGHTAVQVVSPADFVRNDPFIALMDDRIDLAPGVHAGGAHPHAGFEIATFLVEGELRDRDEGTLHAGEAMWTTAGSGVIHNEDVEPIGKSRILQLWMTTPSAARWVQPRFAHMPLAAIPERKSPGARVRVLSGRVGDVVAPAHTHLPLTMLDIHMASRSSTGVEIPAGYNGFVYMLGGQFTVGTQLLKEGEVGWLDAKLDEGTLSLAAGPVGGRAVLYAGERQHVPIVIHGPFVGETRADLQRVSQSYMKGQLPRVSDLNAQKSLAGVPGTPYSVTMASILVVDDTPALRGLVARVLASAGHSVTQASNGKEALRALQSADFDLVVTDIVMPEMEGLELIRAIRKADPDMKIIGMSGGGRGTPSDYLMLAQNFGAVATLEKPFDSDDLLKAVQSALGIPPVDKPA
jgi:redox-sensitive bicupin YhaK (pirin superfamily)/CheY-like chemotaxis protein